MIKLNTQKLLYISIFGGLLGLDKFYQKQYIFGFIKLFTFGLYGIWWIIDIIIIYNKLDKEEGVKLPKIKLNSLDLGVFIKILKIVGYGILLFILFALLLVIFNPNTENVGNTQIETIKTTDKIKEIKVKKIILSNTEKKKIYYIYWQTEHITSLLTIKKFGDGGKQIERDTFFKNTRLKYEKILTKEKGIDFKIYSKNAIEISGEGDDNNWDKPNSNSDNVIKYVYSEKKYNQYLKDKKIEIAFKEIKTSDVIWMQCQGYIVGDGFLSRFKYAKIKKLSNNQVNVYAIYNGKNAFGQKVKQSVICKYKYNDKYGKYEIFDVKF